MLGNPERGFAQFVGETIVKVNASAIDFVTITFASGKVVHVHAERKLASLIVISADSEGWDTGD